jgi:hypothetical protein
MYVPDFQQLQQEADTGVGKFELHMPVEGISENIEEIIPCTGLVFPVDPDLLGNTLEEFVRYGDLAYLDVYGLAEKGIPVGILNAEAGDERLVVPVSGIGIEHLRVGVEREGNVGILVSGHQPDGLSCFKLGRKKKTYTFFIVGSCRG